MDHNSDDAAAAEGPDLLSRPSILLRLAMAGLVVGAALPSLPIPMIAGWTLAWLAVSLCEQVAARAALRGANTLAGFLLTTSLAVLGAVAAVGLVVTGAPGARLFAIALISFSSVNILLRYYAAPRMLLAALTPHGAVMAWIVWRLVATAWAAGKFLEALPPLAALGLYALLLWPARVRLLVAWTRLLTAKAAAEAASRAKSDFLATMSHEIRTPLNGILGVAHVLQREPLSPENLARVRVIRSSGETLLAILNDVLDISAVEAGRLRLEIREFDMEHATRGAVATFASLAEKKGISLRLSIEAGATGSYCGDPVRLRQIVYNLVSNAVKFTERGAVAVCVSYAGGTLSIEVADSGSGIPADKLGQIFDKFVQADASTTRSAGGSGLGLAISRNLVALMGGSIAVNSVEGRGSVFKVSLPMPRIAEATPLAALQGQGAAPAEPRAAPLRILAAEDNEVNRLVLTTLLSQEGLALTVVENGADAVEAWRTRDWDLVLMDIRMPVMDGVAATRNIRSGEAASGRHRVPIIAVTANFSPEQQVEYREAGMDLVVGKPLEVDGLFAAIDHVLAASAGAAAPRVLHA